MSEQPRFMNGFAGASSLIASLEAPEEMAFDQASIDQDYELVPEDPFPVAPRTLEEVLKATQSLAEEISSRSRQVLTEGSNDAPIGDLVRLGAIGLLTAPLPRGLGGLGLGTESQGHLHLLRLLAIIGGADLVLGRLYEGHVNALILVVAYGTDSQIESAAEDARSGKLFGVWNTGSTDPVRIACETADFTVHGTKTFATGASFVQRPIITGELSSGGWQMMLPAMEKSRVARRVSIDQSFWRPFGMESSGSFAITFDGALLEKAEAIGKPGDFYRDPLFRGGAVRFAAVHAGAILRLHRLFANWLQSRGRGNDPYQIARLGEVALNAQEAILWVERAANVSEECFSPTADKLASERMVECANMTRTVIERIATRTMQLVTAGVGAHGLLEPNRFGRIIRDLTMYLRQPSPDQALADIGRASLRKSNLRVDGTEDGAWRNFASEGSLPPSYFQHIYQNSTDPWKFETSPYESDKYQRTLNSLPKQHYHNALEVGCSIGVFTKLIANRCDELLAIDVSDRALDIARDRCSDLRQVRFRKMQVPQEMPHGDFDLILVSEVAYYWSHEDLTRAIDAFAKLQRPGSNLVLVHYTAPVPDYPMTADEVHQTWTMRPEWNLVLQQRHEAFRLDVLERRNCGSPNS